VRGTTAQAVEHRRSQHVHTPRDLRIDPVLANMARRLSPDFEVDLEPE
jgi:hypothetical protein